MSLVTASPAGAQVLRRIGERAKQAAERETAREVDKRVTEIVRCAFDDQECIRKAEREGKKVEKVERGAVGAGSATGAAGATEAGAAPGSAAWANYDFVPGEEVLFAEDFAADDVGDFPRRLQLVAGNMEVVSLDGARWLRATSDARFVIDLPATLPERFTVEFDVHMVNPILWPQLYLVTAPPPGGFRSIATGSGLRSYPYSYFQVSQESGVRGGDGGEALVRSRHHVGKGFVPVRIMADGGHVKMYMGEQRVANVPNATLRRTRQLAFVLGGGVVEDRPVLIGNLRVAGGGRKLYDALAANGRVATQGILFDTGSDRIRPESTPTLKEIGEMLREHADLRLRIEGHTDAVGSAESNRALSTRRAQAVRQYLVDRYGIDAARLEAAGIGQDRPVAPNDTPEGRQRNRRVELVRQ